MAFNSNAAYSIDFRGNTNFGGSGYIESPWFDSESAGFANAFTNYVSTTTTPTGTSVAWQFKTANTPTTYADATAWTSAISSLTGRFIKIRGTITKTDDYGTSSGAVISDVTPYATPQGKAVSIEEACTNLVQYSQELDNAWWTKNISTVLSNSAIAPDGTATADKLIDNSTNNFHYFGRSAIHTIGQTYTTSVYAKAGELNWIWINFGSGPGDLTYFDVLNGVVGSVGTDVTATSIKYVGNGWYRCSATRTNTIGNMNIGVAQSNLGGSYAGTGQGVYIWGLQTEAKSYPTSYVPTTSATATRNAESIALPNGDSLVYPSSGAFITRVYLTAPKSQGYMFRLGSLSSNGIFLIRNTSGFWDLRFVASGGATSSSAPADTTSTSEAWHTIGVTWKPTEATLWLNGSKITTITNPNLPSSVATSVTLGAFSSSAAQINGSFSDFASYNEWLTDTEMASYTATGAVIPLDHRTTYKLDFEGNLLHGEGGYRISPSIALDNIGTITGSTITWSETESSGAVQDFTFSQTSNITVANGNDLTKTGGTESTYNANFVGSRIFNSGENFYVQWKSGETTTYKSVGLTSLLTTFDSVSTSPSLDFQVYMENGGTIDARVNSVTVSSNNVTTYASSDVIRLDCIDNVVKLYKNNSLIYTWSQTPTFPLYFAGSIYNLNGTVIDCQYGLYNKVEVDTSIDNGTTWSAATSASAITGLSSEVSATGKTLLVRQKLTTPRSATSPSVQDVTVRMTQKWANTPSTYIKPVTTKLALTPTNLTKWQLENKKYSTSFISGTRNAEVLTASTGVMTSLSSGSVVARVMFNSLDSSVDNYIVDFAGSGASGLILIWQRTTGKFVLYYGGSTGSATSISSTTSPIINTWYSVGASWDGTGAKIYVNGTLEASGSVAANVVPSKTTIHFGSNNGTIRYLNGYMSQIDIFGEKLTDDEMTAYTAASGAVISVGEKHTYQLLFDNNLEYGLSGIFTSRFIDAGANCAGTPWVTYTKSDTVPAGTSVTYKFGANDTGTGSVTYSEDITDCVGRYLKVKIILTSDDVNAATPSVQSIRCIPQYS